MAVHAESTTPALVASAVVTNPAAAAVIADTGPLSDGNHELRLAIGATVSVLWELQRRDAVNAANVGGVVNIYSSANLTAEYVFSYQLKAGERLRVVTPAAVVGNVAAAMQTEPLA